MELQTPEVLYGSYKLRRSGSKLWQLFKGKIFINCRENKYE